MRLVKANCGLLTKAKAESFWVPDRAARAANARPSGVFCGSSSALDTGRSTLAGSAAQPPIKPEKTATQKNRLVVVSHVVCRTLETPARQLVGHSIFGTAIV